MLLKEAVDNLAFSLGKSDDIAFKSKLKRSISVARAEILRREINKRSSIPYAHTHTLHNLNIIEDKLGYLNSSSKKKVYRTEVRVPKPIMYHNQDSGFIYVGGIDSDSSHQFVKPDRLAFRITRFPQIQYYTYLDGFIFFFDNIKDTNIRAVFSDLIYLEEIKNRDNEICISEIVISDDLFTGIKGLLLGEEVEAGITYKPEVEVNVDRT